MSEQDYDEHSSLIDWGRYGYLVSIATGTLSAISSGLIIYVIFRSQERLSTIYNRIMFGMSVGDIFASIGFALSTLPSPEILPNDENYKEVAFPDAPRFGNVNTCKMQGYVTSCGLIANYGFNVSLCAYYACAIAFLVKEANIRKYIEPFFYVCPLFVGVIVASGNFLKIQNPLGARCVPYASSCTGDGDCNRWAQKIYEHLLTFVIGIDVTLIAIFLSLVFTRVVWMNLKLKWNSSGLRRDPNYRDIVQNAHNTKVIFIQAFSYIIAFFSSAGVNIIHGVTGSMDPKFRRDMNVVFTPLQGFFNFIIFIGHKVYCFKQLHNDATIREILTDIFLTRFSDTLYVSGVSTVELDGIERIRSAQFAEVVENNCQSSTGVLSSTPDVEVSTNIMTSDERNLDSFRVGGSQQGSSGRSSYRNSLEIPVHEDDDTIKN